MGIYINKGNEGFRQIRNSEYIDKSKLIGVVNKTLFTQQKTGCTTRIAATTGERFVFIIDEWDAICRHYGEKPKVMDESDNMLRGLFKDVSAIGTFAGVYMTGTLPIKKYKTQSALNNFLEYSMVEPRKKGKYFGFTKDKVKQLVDIRGRDDVLTVLIHLGYLSFDWKERECYVPNLEAYGELATIYNHMTKEHHCEIERWNKE